MFLISSYPKSYSKIVVRVQYSPVLKYSSEYKKEEGKLMILRIAVSLPRLFISVKIKVSSLISVTKKVTSQKLKIANFFHWKIKYLRKKRIKFCVTKFVFLETSYFSSKRIQIATSWPKKLKSKEEFEINIDWQSITKHTCGHL